MSAADVARCSSREHGSLDPAFVKKVIDGAEPNVLRLALLQLTGDPKLAAMKVVREPRRGGALMSPVLTPEDALVLKRQAFSMLSAGAIPEPAPVSPVEIRRLLEIYANSPLTDDEYRIAYEELGLEDFPRDVKWRHKPAPAVLRNFRVVVVGSGLSGLAMGVSLSRLGIPYTIIEKLDGVGGTWLRNTYPGVRVDTSCLTYQFKFEKNYPWSEYFPTQAELRQYMIHIADKYGITQNIRFNTELIRATWDEQGAKWNLVLKKPDSSEETIEANVVVSAAGLFGRASLPDIPGINQYKGRILHTTDWDHGYDYAGKRIALIGNGSTGTQLMPSVAEKAKSVTAFQRTPQWIGPMENHRQPISSETRWLFDNVPLYWNWYCYAAFFNLCHMQYVQENDPEWKKKGGLVSEGNDRLREVLTDYIHRKLAGRPDLIAKSIPRYAPLARRLVVDNGWYDALLRDNVELVTTGIQHFTESGIVDCAGAARHFDMIILSTGFEVSKYLHPVEYRGRNGMLLEKAWEDDGPRSYLGVTMPGFPNFFMLYGPGSQARAGGLPSWMEVWTRYILEHVVRMVETGGSSIEVRQEVFDTYNESVDAHARDLVWETDGKGGYYVTREGRSFVNQPWRIYKYHAALASPDPADFVIR